MIAQQFRDRGRLARELIGIVASGEASAPLVQIQFPGIHDFPSRFQMLLIGDFESVPIRRSCWILLTQLRQFGSS
jgi:hypothetical protein